MNRFANITKPLTWFMALLLVAFVAGCGGGGGGGNDTAASSSAKRMITYSIGAATGTINETLKTISVTKPYGTDITAMVATFTYTGAKVTVSDAAQINVTDETQTSGTTANDFTNPVAYKVTAANGTWATYTVLVTIALNTAKAITSYSLAWTTGTPGSAVGVISGAASPYAIAVTVPYGTGITALVATFTTTGDSVKIGGTPQNSGLAPTNNFGTSKSYVVTAADGSFATYDVSVTVALNTAKAITDYSLDGMPGTINGVASPYTIAVTMPYGTTDLTALVATFTTTGDSVKIGDVTQVSAPAVDATPNNFTTSKTYTVTAENGSSATYTVTVSVALNPAKAITAYSLAWATGTPGSAVGAISGVASPYAIAVTAPSGTDLTTLVATFTTTGDSVKIGIATQTSGSTPTNDFTNSVATPVAYLVTAEDGSTATYNVTVTLATAAGQAICTGTVSACVNLGTAANYVILDEATVTYTPIATVGPATITGDIGLYPAAASFLTGFPTSPPLDATECFSTSTQVTGKLYAADYNTLGCLTPGILSTAIDDKNFAYGFAAGKATAGGGLDYFACPGAGDMSDVNNELQGFPVGGLPPGVYTCGVAITIPGDLTLNGGATDVWVFKTSGTLEQATGKNVILAGSALPQNVFWQVAGGVLIQATAHMEGVVLSDTNIELITGATVNGRLLARTGVLMDSNTVTQPTP